MVARVCGMAVACFFLVSTVVRGAPPDTVAQQMIGAIDDVTFSSGGMAALTRTTSIPAEQWKATAHEFEAAYTRATGKTIALTGKKAALQSDFTLRNLLARLRFYDNGVFQPVRASQYAARLGSLDKGMLKQWSAALRRVDGLWQYASDLELAFVLIEVEPLFTEASVTPGASERMLMRLDSLGTSPVARWRAALGTGNIDVSFATLSLLGADGLFAADRFQEDVFAKALPIAERLIVEARARAKARWGITIGGPLLPLMWAAQLRAPADWNRGTGVVGATVARAVPAAER